MKLRLLCLILLLCSVCVFAKQDVPKEWAEWSQIWREGASQTDLPHVLLIGDSIVHGYRDKVQEKLGGKFYVDKLATSRSIDQDYYWKQIDMVINDEDYDIILFNFGLHGFHIGINDYSKGMNRVADILKKTKAKIGFISTTPLAFLNEQYKELNNCVLERNAVAKRIAEKNKFEYIDLYNLVYGIENIRAEGDAYHYNSAGVEMQAQFISEKISEMYSKK